MSARVENQSLQSFGSFLGGYLGGLTSTLIGSPLDTIKVRLQLQSNTNPLYKGLLDCAVKITRQEGPTAFYRGTVFPLLTAGCFSSAGVSLSYQYRDTIATLAKSEESRFIHSFLGGGLAGATTSLMITPFEHMRIRMQVQSDTNPAYKNSMQCVKDIARRHGVKGIYNGLKVTALRSSSTWAWSMATYEHIKNTVFKKDAQAAGILQPIVCGAVAGTLSRITSYPLDCIKSRIQVDCLENPTYKSIYDCYSKTVKAEGYRALFRGMTPTIVQGLPTNAGFWATYELVRSMINKNKTPHF
jgi:solute carrier family 25 carnitine/acylcarnitine transporter 20/29